MLVGPVFYHGLGAAGQMARPGWGVRRVSNAVFQQERTALFLYYRISFVLSVLALAAWAIAVTLYQAPRYGDGYGPDPLGVLLFLALWPVGLLLAHSGLLACLVRARRPASILQGRQGVAIHLALGAGFVLYALYRFWPG
ncbi:hypothetical protein [Bordetella bronchiseptica]|uniref:hypothetical protein n=1 Tax=Bordetella bronchiseptica TaxID=518 RepID=UPI001F44C2F6|nr:hypothetical protein [Bordetella bronchiseptica]